MLINYLGKLLFPRWHRSQDNHQFIIIAATLSLGLIVAGSVVAVMIWRGATGQ
jgi:hypothetical protein